LQQPLDFDFYFSCLENSINSYTFVEIKSEKVIGKFFHTPQPKKFHIPPRYHDPYAEARENRERMIKEELGIIDKKIDAGLPFMSNIKGQFRMAQGTKSKSSEIARKNSNTRLIILILILAFIFYLFFYSDFLF
jgi:hypothetical protein